jgi:hypothetical protein
MRVKEAMKVSMDEIDKIEVIKSLVNSLSGKSSWGCYDYYADESEDNDKPVYEEDEEYEEYRKDAEAFRRNTRLLAQRKKEVIAVKKKLADRLFKLDGAISSLKKLVEKYGHLEDSAELLAAALLELDDEEV